MLKRPPRRVSFVEKKEIIDLPNLIEIQVKSYNQFLQINRFPDERENIGLQEAFTEIFPIKSSILLNPLTTGPSAIAKLLKI